MTSYLLRSTSCWLKADALTPYQTLVDRYIEKFYGDKGVINIKDEESDTHSTPNTQKSLINDGEKNVTSYALKMIDGVIHYECGACPKLFKKRSALEWHRIAHSNDKPFSCKICSVTFKSKYYKKAHMKLHLKDAGWTCKWCKKTFTSKRYQLNHGCTHATEKQFECETCHKTFASNYTLKKHMITHAAERSTEWTCEMCGKILSSKWNLDTHMRTHVGDRPFKCEICKTSFTMKSSLETWEEMYWGQTKQL